MTTQRSYANGRLVYYRQAADAQHWDAVWKSQDTERLYAEAAKGELDYYTEIFPRHLPRTGKILEAGCGLGQFVIALRQRGYDAEGVDYAEGTIRFLNQRFPEQPFRVADVTAMDVPDGYYSGYISLGVMEHLQEGPQQFLQETYRILSPGGVACISVPNLNFLRRLKARLGLYGRPGSDTLPFYQLHIPQRNSPTSWSGMVLKCWLATNTVAIRVSRMNCLGLAKCSLGRRVGVCENG